MLEISNYSPTVPLEASNGRRREDASSPKSRHDLKAHISLRNASHASPWEDESQLNDRSQDVMTVFESMSFKRVSDVEERDRLRNGAAAAVRLRALLTLRTVIAAIIHKNIARNCILTVW